MPAQMPEPSELIYAPGDSWGPVLVAAALALIIVGAFTQWWWTAIGVAVLLLGVRSWWRQSNDEVSSMRRSQPLDTAVIPAEPIRKP